MADPVSLALKGAVTAYDLCKGTYKLIQGIKKAPDDVRRVATDLKGFYGILGALEHAVRDQERYLKTPGPALYQLQNVSTLLEDCVSAFKELQERVQSFVAVNGNVINGTWEAFKWDQFQKEDIQYLRSHLSNIKLSLNVALSSLTL
ncbi:hypothetical protein LTR85_012138 [Meristemomyces frigidus]|nr:hypothetical protein LTR85_012138 [Meristemomyces frigidus]